MPVLEWELNVTWLFFGDLISFALFGALPSLFDPICCIETDISSVMESSGTPSLSIVWCYIMGELIGLLSVFELSFWIAIILCFTFSKSVFSNFLFLLRYAPYWQSLRTSVEIFSRLKLWSLVNENILSLSRLCTMMNTSELQYLTTCSAFRKSPRFLT